MAGSERGASREDRWLDPAHVFTDTGRVDLFDDPRWDLPPQRPARRARSAPAVPDDDRPRRPGLLASLLSSLAGRSTSRRGRHVRGSAAKGSLITSSSTSSGSGRPWRD